jgi:hypothetical protein
MENKQPSAKEQSKRCMVFTGPFHSPRAVSDFLSVKSFPRANPDFKHERDTTNPIIASLLVPAVFVSSVFY